MSRRHLSITMVVGVLAIAGCSDEDRADLLDDATEVAVRNFAALQGAEQLDHEGYPIDDEGLACTADVGDGGLESVEIECTGTTDEGADVVLTGITSELPGASITELKGTFTATVDGAEIFETDQLGG
jgi:hypothetical protein